MLKPALSMLLCSLLITSCSLGGGASAPAAPPGVLFQDDFSDTGSGWDRQDTDVAVTDYADGVYRIFVRDSNMDYWANPGGSYTDVRVEVDATKVGGSDDNDFGLICRYVDVDNFYFGLISSDGFSIIGKLKDGEQQGLSSSDMEATDGIRAGSATNAIRLDCVGEALSLYVNGAQIASAADSEFSEGDVGLIAGTFSEGGTDIHFDNFSVREP